MPLPLARAPRRAMAPCAMLRDLFYAIRCFCLRFIATTPWRYAADAMLLRHVALIVYCYAVFQRAMRMLSTHTFSPCHLFRHYYYADAMRFSPARCVMPLSFDVGAVIFAIRHADSARHRVLLRH